VTRLLVKGGVRGNSFFGWTVAVVQLQGAHLVSQWQRWATPRRGATGAGGAHFVSEEWVEHELSWERTDGAETGLHRGAVIAWVFTPQTLGREVLRGSVEYGSTSTVSRVT
jgi:hypothetical protein